MRLADQQPADEASGSAPAPFAPVHGRAPRVALLVYNDAHADARVIKTAASLRDAGAQVRVFAVARARAGHPEGASTVGRDLNVPVHRSAEFELQRYAPWALQLARRVTGRPEPGAGPGGQLHTTPSTAADVDTSETAPSRWRRVLTDGWLRTYRTVSLGLYWIQAARAASAWRPDVVHANDGNTLAPAWWVRQRTGAQVVYDAHELWRHRNVRQDRPMAPMVEAAIESLVIRRAAGVITVSPSIATWLHTTYGLPARPTLVRNAPRGTAEPTTGGRLRAMAGLDDGTKVIAYGGRITTSRGIEETLQALALLPGDTHFVLLGYGEPDYLAVLRAQVEALHLTARVHLVGAVGAHEVSSALSDADLSVVFVRPVCLSYEFSLPNKLFESIHAGLPVVAADLPDTAAVVREHGVGAIFDVDSPADMARTMAQVLGHPEPYRRAARAAARLLTWQHEEHQLIELYHRVLDR